MVDLTDIDEEGHLVIIVVFDSGDQIVHDDLLPDVLLKDLDQVDSKGTHLLDLEHPLQ